VGFSRQHRLSGTGESGVGWDVRFSELEDREQFAVPVKCAQRERKNKCNFTLIARKRLSFQGGQRGLQKKTNQRIEKGIYAPEKSRHGRETGESCLKVAIFSGDGERWDGNPHRYYRGKRGSGTKNFKSQWRREKGRRRGWSILDGNLTENLPFVPGRRTYGES